MPLARGIETQNRTLLHPPQKPPKNTPKTAQKHPKNTPKTPQKHPILYPPKNPKNPSKSLLKPQKRGQKTPKKGSKNTPKTPQKPPKNPQKPPKTPKNGLFSVRLRHPPPDFGPPRKTPEKHPFFRGVTAPPRAKSAKKWKIFPEKVKKSGNWRVVTAHPPPQKKGGLVQVCSGSPTTLYNYKRGSREVPRKIDEKSIENRTPKNDQKTRKHDKSRMKTPKNPPKKGSKKGQKSTKKGSKTPKNTEKPI